MSSSNVRLCIYLHSWAPFGNNRCCFPSRDAVAEDRRPVPTLFRFIVFTAFVTGLVFGGMVALVTFVKPEPREMVETVPPSKLQPR